jgi:hypothetical protein
MHPVQQDDVDEAGWSTDLELNQLAVNSGALFPINFPVFYSCKSESLTAAVL